MDAWNTGNDVISIVKKYRPRHDLCSVEQIFVIHVTFLALLRLAARIEAPSFAAMAWLFYFPRHCLHQGSCLH